MVEKEVVRTIAILLTKAKVEMEGLEEDLVVIVLELVLINLVVQELQVKVTMEDEEVLNTTPVVAVEQEQQVPIPLMYRTEV